MTRTASGDEFHAPDDATPAEYRVPDGATAAVCDRCGRPFPTDRLRALHLGLAHGGDLAADERAAFEAAEAAETADVRVFRVQAVGALVLLYFGFLFTYAVVG